MAKRATEVNRFKLEMALKTAEANGPLATRSLLWEKVAEIYNQTETPISVSVVMLRIQEWNLPLKTQPGKRGAGPMTPERIAAMQAARGTRVPRGEKFAADPKIQAHFDELEKNTPERFKLLVLKIRNGSKSAAEKLHCIQCGNYSSAEIRECTVTSCAKWAFRPYQKDDGDEDEDAPGDATEAADITDANDTADGR